MLTAVAHGVVVHRVVAPSFVMWVIVRVSLGVRPSVQRLLIRSFFDRYDHWHASTRGAS